MVDIRKFPGIMSSEGIKRMADDVNREFDRKAAAEAHNKRHEIEGWETMPEETRRERLQVLYENLVREEEAFDTKLKFESNVPDGDLKKYRGRMEQLRSKGRRINDGSDLDLVYDELLAHGRNIDFESSML